MADPQTQTQASTPTPVDMFGPDGQVHEVQPGDVQAALSSGGEFAHQLKGPDGQIHYVRHSQLGDALRSGGVPVAANQQNQSDIAPQQPGAIARFAQTFGISTSMNELRSMGEAEDQKPIAQRLMEALPGGALPKMVTGFIQNAASGIQEGQSNLQNLRQQVQSGKMTPEQAKAQMLTAGSPFLRTLPVYGSTLENMQKDAAAGNAPGLAGSVVGLATQAVLPEAMERLGIGTAGKPLTTGEAAEKITNAVNPPPKSMSAFQSSVQEHLPKAIQTAQEQGIPITGREGLAKAFTAAADKAKGTYYNEMLGPVKDVAIDTSGIRGYQGATSYYNTATLSQLDARLAEINSTLSPAYEKGGAAARAAITAESRASLNAEASAIRDRLYQEIADRTGIDKDAISSTKSSMGSMYGIADKITTAVNKERFAANQAAQGANPPHSGAELLYRLGNKGYKKFINNPDAKTAQAVSGVSGEQ